MDVYMLHGSIPRRVIDLEIPINVTTTVGQVRNIARELVSHLEQQ